MTKIEIQETIQEISKILLDANINEWGRSMLKLSKEIEENTEETKKKILRLYGGMGSFNDILIYEEGKISKEKTEKLDSLRLKLFDMCQKEK